MAMKRFRILADNEITYARCSRRSHCTFPQSHRVSMLACRSRNVATPFLHCRVVGPAGADAGNGDEPNRLAPVQRSPGSFGALNQSVDEPVYGPDERLPILHFSRPRGELL